MPWEHVRGNGVSHSRLLKISLKLLLFFLIGNGTEQMFRSVANPTYLSIHRYDHGRFFPGDLGGATASVGLGLGAGHNVNICWSGGGAGDAEYLAAFDQVVLPLAQALKPTVILVSAGFDAADGDPLGGCKVTPQGYGAMTRKLLTEVPSARGRVLLFLEGGYRLTVLPPCVRHCLEALLEPPTAVSDADETAHHEEKVEGKEVAAALASAFVVAAGVAKAGTAKARFASGDDGGASPASVLLAPRSSASSDSSSHASALDGGCSARFEASPLQPLDDAAAAAGPGSDLELPASPFSSRPSGRVTGYGAASAVVSAHVEPCSSQALKARGSADLTSGGGEEAEEEEESVFAWEKGLLPAAVDAILDTRGALGPFWPCLRD
jgi:hypothetical protein